MYYIITKFSIVTIIMHETYAIFDSKNMKDSTYNLFIKTTPRQITSFQIISARLPVFTNIPYISMKIQNLENTISLNTDSSNDNLFSIFYFNEEDEQHNYKIFKTQHIYPNKIEFNKPLQSLSRLQIKWYDNFNNIVFFTKPRYKVNTSVLFHHNQSILYGIILTTLQNKIITYTIQEYHDDNIYTIQEGDIIQFSIADLVFVKHNDKYYSGVVLKIEPYEIYIPSLTNIVNFTTLND